MRVGGMAHPAGSLPEPDWLAAAGIQTHAGAGIERLPRADRSHVAGDAKEIEAYAAGDDILFIQCAGLGHRWGFQAHSTSVRRHRF